MKWCYFISSILVLGCGADTANDRPAANSREKSVSAASVTGEEQPPSAKANTHLRVATFNINWGNVNLPDIKRAIVASKADVVCIQESTRRSEQFLTRFFRDEYPQIVFRGHRGRYAAERFGFLSKRPLEDIHFLPPEHGLFGTLFATIRHRDREVRIANVHLSPFAVPRGAGFRGAVSALSGVEGTHAKEIQSIATQIDPSRPTLVCGDFNSLSSFSAPKRLEQMGLTESFAAITENADSHSTWGWPFGKRHIQFRIDYIFHSRHFATVGSEIIPTEGSDHALVVSEFEENTGLTDR